MITKNFFVESSLPLSFHFSYFTVLEKKLKEKGSEGNG
jgi:hypothetical protein